MLSQLSYSPSVLVRDTLKCVREVGLARLELATSALSGLRSNHLSYRPSNALANPFAEGLASQAVSNGHGFSKTAHRSLKTESENSREWSGLTELVHALDCENDAP